MRTYRGGILLWILLLIVSAMLGGCTSFYADVAKVIPPGNYRVISATVTGKFSATQFTGEHVYITPAGRMEGGHVHVRHSNVYVPLIEFDIQAEDSPAQPAPVPPVSKSPDAPISISPP